MKAILNRDNNSPITFNMEHVISITANGSQLFVKLGPYKTECGNKITINN